MYYFDTRECANFTTDDEGLDCPSLDIAEREAVIAAAEMARGAFPQGSRDIVIQIRNEHGQRVSSVRVAMEIDRA
jgi:hypothetical protein